MLGSSPQQGQGSRATAEALDLQILAFAGMTKNIQKLRLSDHET